MVNLRQIFGRRMLLFGVAVIALITAITGIVLFYNSVNAVTPEWEGNNYKLEDSYLTANVQAARNADFDAEFKYTFDFIEPDTSSGDDGEVNHKSVAVTTLTIAEQTLDVKAINGKIQPKSGAKEYTTAEVQALAGDDAQHAKTDNDVYFVAPGHGTAGTDLKAATKFNNTDASVYGYIHGKKLSSFITIPDPTTAQTDFKTMFPEPGKYQWKVTSTITKPTGTDDLKHWENSRSVYYFVITVGVDTDGKYYVMGTTYFQTRDDQYQKAAEDKKDPELIPLLSDIQYYSDGSHGSETGLDGYVYRGFTFAYLYRQDPEQGDFDVFKLTKIATAKEPATPDVNKDFTFDKILFISNTFNNLDTTAGKTARTSAEPYTVIGCKVAKDGTESKVAFTTTKGSNPDGVNVVPGTATLTANGITLKHSEYIIFDGITHGSGADEFTATKLPVGTYYQIHEESTAQHKPSASVEVANIAKSTSDPKNPQDFSGSIGEALGVQYTAVGTPASTYNAATNAIIGETPETAFDPAMTNQVVFTNENNETVLGNLIDIVPYIIMIGIPFAALAIWIVSRKRKENN